VICSGGSGDAVMHFLTARTITLLDLECSPGKKIIPIVVFKATTRHPGVLRVVGVPLALQDIYGILLRPKAST